MVDFRRWVTALAVLALFTGLACAQIGTPATLQSASNPFTCAGNAAATPQLRSEGFTELVGDILISCTGGSPIAVGQAIPQTNITVYILGSSSITSRLLGNNGISNASEALLLIDDPGSSLPTLTPGFGPSAPQVLCGNPQSGCVEYAQTQTTTATPAPGTVEVASSAAAPFVNGPNVFQGIWNNGLGNNAVTFYGVPVLPPATTGITRSFRITNIRVTTAGVPAQTGITAQISTNGSTGLALTTSSLLVGIVANSLTTSVSTKNLGQPYLQCVGQTNTKSAVLSFAENGVGTAFKTRVVPLSATTVNGSQGQNLNVQNIPGGFYNGFLQASESGFIFPALTSNTGNSTTTTTPEVAGLADYGTRLKAIFTNIPTGVTIYIPVASDQTVTVPGNNTVSTPMAQLVSSEGVSDGTSFPVVSATFTKTATPTIPLVVTNGTGTAVWEVVNQNPNAIDTLTFSIYISYSPATAKNQPTPTSPAPFSPGNVQMWYAPEPSQGAFAASAGPVANSSALIPRFTTPTTTPQPWLNVNICQTALLWPFVTNVSGFDTGIAISNTSTDPFNTASPIAQNGSCTLNWYGTTTTATGTGAAPTATIGCDTPGAPALCVPVISTGTTWSNNLGTLLPNAGFTGYLIGVCNFQYAHGYAAVTDLGIQHILSSYLALVLEGANGIILRPNVPSAETLTH